VKIVSERYKRYDWDSAEFEIKEKFGDKFRKGEHVEIFDSESANIFGKSIRDANCGVCILEHGDRSATKSPTVCRHLARIGFSSRVGWGGGIKFVEIWMP
jgi:hypothetical protein